MRRRKIEKNSTGYAKMSIALMYAKEQKSVRVYRKKDREFTQCGETRRTTPKIEQKREDTF